MTNKREEGYIRPPGPDPHPRAVHWLQLWAANFFTGMAYLLPAPLIQACGKGIGTLSHALAKKHRKIALLNMDRMLPELGEDEKKALVKACFQSLGCVLMETLSLAKITKSNYRQWVRFDNLEALRQPIAEGKGAILCTAHYGNWEIMNLALGFENLPMSVMARPMDNPLIHKKLERIRTRSGNQVIYKHKSVRKLLTALRENRVVGIVNDQNVHDRNKMMVPFFGFEASTTPTPAAVSLKTGAPIITGYAIPEGRGTYLVRFDDPLVPNPDAPKVEETQRLTVCLNQRLERQIRETPHCWFWVHKRYKTGDDGPTGYYEKKRAI